MKGITRYWIEDIRKIKKKTLDIKNVISMSKLNPLIKKDTLRDIEIIMMLLGKGKQ